MINIGTKVFIKPRTYLYKNLAGKIGTVVGSYVTNSNTCYSERVEFVKFEDRSELLCIPEKYLCIADPTCSYKSFSSIPLEIQKIMASYSSTVEPITESIEKIIFSGPKTIIIWKDKTKTIVSCGEGDQYDEYSGFCAAVCKKLFGSTTKIKKTIDLYRNSDKEINKMINNSFNISEVKFEERVIQDWCYLEELYFIAPKEWSAVEYPGATHSTICVELQLNHDLSLKENYLESASVTISPTVVDDDGNGKDIEYDYFTLKKEDIKKLIDLANK